ncbi:MAG: response regulator transcription factor [Eubacteriales bacterium]|nr:response regulator transcription factor [Eubacteriales bacterium]
MEKKKVLICDDQYLIRQLFSLIVSGSENYTVVKELQTAYTAADYCREHEVDLVIMDIVMPDGSNGLDAAWQIKNENKNIKVLIVTSMPEAGYLDRARAIGVDSFWYKEVEDEQLIDVIDRTMNGEKIFPDEALTVDIGWAKSSDFSKRELDVLRLMTKGMTDPEIAEELQLSYETVRTHVKRMTSKTGLSRVKLAIEARAHGIAIGE